MKGQSIIKRLYLCKKDPALAAEIKERGYDISSYEEVTTYNENGAITNTTPTIENDVDNLISSDVFVIEAGASQTDWALFGYALALGEELIVITNNTPCPSVCYLPDIQMVPDEAALLEML